MATPKFEYKFVRLGEGYLAARKEGTEGYQEEVHKHAAEGWRLVQIYAPSTGIYGAAKYVELVFERPDRSAPNDPW